MSRQYEEFFADTVRRADFVGGMIRLEFATLVPSDTQGEAPKLESRRMEIMPLEGFLNAYSVMQDLLRKLQEAGVVKRGGTD
ncbi:MAG: hypothetical protein ABT940_10745 [Alphaproteobacteria bacterium]